MEYLYQINPVLQQGNPVIIYGIDDREKGIFFALLQQKVYVTAFCLREEQKTSLRHLYNKRVINIERLKEEYSNANVIVPGHTAADDIEVLGKYGIKSVVVENISLKERGILFVGE